jgi:TolB-like protein/Flp pilus assembly protein TadD
VAGTVSRLLAKQATDRHSTGAQVVAELRSAYSTPAGSTPAIGLSARPSDVKSIAVLPFVNVSADPENEFFSDGLTDEITTDLAGVKGLRLTSRNSSMQMKGSAKPLREIGQELGVRFLLTGSVRKAGNALRITAQLVDADTDTPLWAEKYGGTMDDVFDVQERVSRAIVGALQVQLSSQEDARLGARRIRDPRAFELYLQARDEMRRYGVSLDRAATLLARAIDIEGETPPLRALRAFMEFSRVRGGTHTDMRPLDIAESEARALIEQMPDAPYGHALLGFVGYERGHLADAARHLTRALELDPTDADVMFFLIITLQAANQIEAGQRLAKRFHEVDPLSPFSGAMLCCTEWFAGNIGRHVEKLEQALVIDPHNAILTWALGYTYALMGRVDDAEKRAHWMRANAPQLPYTAQLSALVESSRGRRDAARETLARIDLAPLDAHQTFHLAESFAMAGDTSTALTLLEFAVDHGMYPYRFYQEFCPFMQPLRGLPEFDRIVGKAARRAAEFSAQ